MGIGFDFESEDENSGIIGIKVNKAWPPAYIEPTDSEDAPVSIPREYRHLQQEFERGGLIIPGYGAEGVKLGNNRAAVFRRLGPDYQVWLYDDFGKYEWKERGVTVYIDKTGVSAIILYGDGNTEGYQVYPGKTPENITGYSVRGMVREAYGIGESSVDSRHLTTSYKEIGLRFAFATRNRRDDSADIEYISVQPRESD